MAKNLNLEPGLSYDQDADVLYISLFSSPEPVCTEEFDDSLLVDRGMFTGQVIGCRFLDVHEHGIEQILLQYGEQILTLIQESRQAVESQQNRLERYSLQLADGKLRDQLRDLVGA